MDDFDSVSWRNEHESTTSRPDTVNHNEAEERSTRLGTKAKRRTSSNALQAGHDADGVDLGGIGDGRLDCTVDTPLKENDGTKDAYVSYLVTTHVRYSRTSLSNVLSSMSTIDCLSSESQLITSYTRPTSSHSKSQPSPSVAASPISFSSTKRFQKNILPVQYHLFPISTKWNTYEAIGLALTLPNAVPTLSTASLNV